MTGIRSNRFFNDAGFAQAASNLVEMFRPPTGAEASAWADANAKREEASRLAKYFDLSLNPETDWEMLDRAGIGAGRFNPSQSLEAVDRNNATQRYGYDNQATTSRANNAADNARMLQTNQLDNNRSLLGTLFQPLNPGQVRPELPSSLAAQYGMPDVTVPGVAGAPKPLSETEMKAGVQQRLIDSGEISNQMLVDAIVGERAPVEVAGPDGPRYMTPGAAVRTGAQPYDRPSAERVDNFLAVGEDGREVRFPGYVGPDGRIRDSNTGNPVPNVIRREGTGGGMSFEVDGQGGVRFSTGGDQTVSRQTDLQSQEAESARASSELTALFDNLRSDDLGVAGNVNDLLTNYAAQIYPDLARTDVAAARNQMKATTLGLARALVSDDRLSDADRRAANAVMVSDGLGESLPGARAKLASLIALNAYRQKFAGSIRTGAGPLPPLDRAMLGRLVDEGAISPRVAQTYATDVLSRVPHSPNGVIPGVDMPAQAPRSTAPAVAPQRLRFDANGNQVQ
ncbi:hypothetical protein [Aquibium microcysteis]|uniref:hypothetical protein n=1 Tax=Aquibium microcysteis TaxID=675281 RepID=UPI00165D065B|nr:hypothetical protein [Aquibium microcysteis]